VGEEPVEEEPVIEEPVGEEPVEEEPVIEEPVEEEPVIEEPVIEEPVVEEPVVEEPVVIEETTSEELWIQNNIDEELWVKQQSVEEPVIQKVIEDNPVVLKTDESIVIDEPKKQTLYLRLLQIFYNNGSKKSGEEIPSYADFKKSIDGKIKELSEKDVKDFLLVCNLFRITEFKNGIGYFEKNYQDASYLISRI
jgi:hypothetical protein